MFENVEALSYPKHKDLKFTPANDFSFAKNQNNAPIFMGEIGECAKHFTILFPVKGRLLPLVLLGLEEGTNKFVDQEGKWTTSYVPAHFRRYPFILSKTVKSNEFQIMFDKDAPNFESDKGEPLLDSDGKLGDVAKKAKSMLENLQKDLLKAESVLQKLEENNLLTEQKLSVKAGDKTQNIVGFRVVDREAVAKLSDDRIVEFVKSGLMGVIYYHWQSLANVKNLVAISKS